MPILVTGASGFLGGRLAEILAGKGEEVTVLARVGSDLRHLSGYAGDRIQVINGGLTDTDSVKRATSEATHIFHCAAASTDWGSADIYFETNVKGTEMLLHAAREARQLQRFVHVSTTDVYGYPAVPCSELGRMRDVGLPYNRTKILAEEAVWSSAQEDGLPVTVFRPATIYGPRGRAFVTDVANLLEKGQMAYIDGGRATGGFLYVDNAVEAMITAAWFPGAIGRAYNLTDGTGASWRQYVDTLAEGLGLKTPWINLPYAAAVWIASAMEAPYRWIESLPGRPMLTRHAVALLGKDQEFPSDRARSELGAYSRVSFEDGMARSVAWLKGLAKAKERL